jgi:hypothetical protein
VRRDNKADVPFAEEAAGGPEMVPVRVIGAKGESALVEWEAGGRLRRNFVPVDKIAEDACDAVALEVGIPYGLPWEVALDLSGVTPEAVADKLRRAGIWTLEDLRDRDRQLLRIGTDMIGSAVWKAARQGGGGEG